MSTFWNIAYINANNLAPGAFEPLKLPKRLVANGSESVIKTGIRVFITDVKIRSISFPNANDPTAGLFLAENGQPVEYVLPSFDARDGWHPSSPIVIEGDELLQRELLLVCSSLIGQSDRFLVHLSGYVEG